MTSSYTLLPLNWHTYPIAHYLYTSTHLDSYRSRDPVSYNQHLIISSCSLPLSAAMGYSAPRYPSWCLHWRMQSEHVLLLYSAAGNDSAGPYPSPQISLSQPLLITVGKNTVLLINLRHWFASHWTFNILVRLLIIYAKQLFRQFNCFTK
jgi:hypothetical protein